jgi:hypothetical protein
MGTEVKVDCESTVTFQSTYTSEMEVFADWWSNFLFGNWDAEAYAFDEVFLVAQDKALFNKAIGNQRGNQITETTSFSFGPKIEQTEKGFGASAEATFGYQITTSGKKGGFTNTLAAFGQDKSKIPFHSLLQSNGVGTINFEGRAVGFAQVHTLEWGTWWYGESTCPGAGSTYGYTVYGHDIKTRDALLTVVKAFLSVNVGNVQ